MASSPHTLLLLGTGGGSGATEYLLLGLGTQVVLFPCDVLPRRVEQEEDCPARIQEENAWPARPPRCPGET